MNGPICRCGQVFCHKENHAYFMRVKRTGRHVRARVFLWDVKRAWTWCPVLNGYALDDGYVMGHYHSQARAFADAQAYTRGEYGSEQPS